MDERNCGFCEPCAEGRYDECEMRREGNLRDAAPDLLFALERIIRELPQRRDWLDPVTERIAKAAIAKAKGIV